MREHLAILKLFYLRLILEGRKTIECRLTRIKYPPFRLIDPGDLILLKQSGGPVCGRARVKKVQFYENLTPARVQEIRRSYNHLILGEEDYWESHQNSRYGSLIWLEKVEKIPPYRLPGWNMKSWKILSEP